MRLGGGVWVDEVGEGEGGGGGVVSFEVVELEEGVVGPAGLVKMMVGCAMFSVQPWLPIGVAFMSRSVRLCS